jgi:dephospho-CoA kinase
MRSVALTGGLACGKSLAGAILAEAGVPVCDADDLAHELMRPGGKTYRPIVETFGREILDAQGRIDRGRLARLVFADAGQREKLNAIVHPHVQRRWRAWLAARPSACDLAVVIIPLLFEIGDEKAWDVVICVTARPEIQQQRLRDRGLSEAEVQARLAAQWPVAAKAARSDYVIENNDTRDEFARTVRETLARVRNEA